jgi:hypothetical protein
VHCYAPFHRAFGRTSTSCSSYTLTIVSCEEEAGEAIEWKHATCPPPEIARAQQPSSSRDHLQHDRTPPASTHLYGSFLMPPVSARRTAKHFCCTSCCGLNLNDVPIVEPMVKTVVDASRRLADGVEAQGCSSTSSSTSSHNALLQVTRAPMTHPLYHINVSAVLASLNVDCLITICHQYHDERSNDTRKDM